MIAIGPLALAADLASTTGTRGLIMIDKVGGAIRLFDPATDQELAVQEPGERPNIKPHDLAITADHRTAYVTVYGDGVYGNNPTPGHSIAIVDLMARKMVGVDGLCLCPRVRRGLRYCHTFLLSNSAWIFFSSSHIRVGPW